MLATKTTAVSEGPAVIDAVKLSRNYATDVCKRQSTTIRRRLFHQKEIAERRMRELVFELIGEYAKSNTRLTRRQEYLKFTSRISVTWHIWKLQWDRFALRLCYESCRNSDKGS